MNLRRKFVPSGFTLVELMVVMVVLAIAASMVMLSVSAAEGHALESSAEHLASSLEEARWQAVSTGRRIAWESPPASATSQYAIEGQWYDQAQDGVWHLRAIPASVKPLPGLRVAIAQPAPILNTPARLVLGPEPVGTVACVLLTLDGNTLAVVSDGVSPFSVRRDAHC